MKSVPCTVVTTNCSGFGMPGDVLYVRSEAPASSAAVTKASRRLWVEAVGRGDPGLPSQFANQPPGGWFVQRLPDLVMKVGPVCAWRGGKARVRTPLGESAPRLLFCRPCGVTAAGDGLVQTDLIISR
jgi:hypothetical protein